MSRSHRVAIMFVACALWLTACASPGPTVATDTAPVISPGSTRQESDAPLAPSDSRTAMTRWDLWTGGETQLRGINIHQRIIYEGWDDPEYYGDGPVGPVFTQADFDALADRGANYVNISHPGLFTVDPPFEPDEGSQANLDRLLDMIAQADMFAVISFRTGPGRSELTFWGVSEDDEMAQSLLNDSVWEDQAAQDAWVEMWRYTAERYSEHPVVVGYDLTVEPNSSAVFFDIYWPPDFYPAYADTTYDWNQFYPRLVEGIREIDSNTPILVGAMSFSQVDWLPYLELTGDPRTVYTVHQYAPHDYTHQEPADDGSLPNTYPGEMDLDWDGEPDDLDRAWLDEWLAPIDEFRDDHGMPVAVNEYGVMRFEPGAPEYLDDITGLLEERGLNYALWSWSPEQVLRYGDIQEFEYRLGPDPDNLTEEVPNELLEVITGYWQRNTLRPSTVRFTDSP